MAGLQFPTETPVPLHACATCCWWPALQIFLTSQPLQTCSNLGKIVNFSTNPMGWNIRSPMSSKPSPGKGLLLTVTFLFSPRVPDMIFLYLQLLFYQSLTIQYIILNLFNPLCGFYLLTGPSLIQLCFKGIKT